MLMLMQNDHLRHTIQSLESTSTRNTAGRAQVLHSDAGAGAGMWRGVGEGVEVGLGVRVGTGKTLSLGEGVEVGSSAGLKVGDGALTIGLGV